MNPNTFSFFISTDELLDKLAELEHKQWMQWTRSVSRLIDECDDVPDELMKKRESWKLNWKRYDNLTEEEKDKDREWAKKIIEIIEEHD